MYSILMMVYNMVCKLIYSLLIIFFCGKEGGKKNREFKIN